MKKLTKRETLDLIRHHFFTGVQVHHTWKPNHDDFTGDNHIRLQEGMRNYHVNTNGWSDIAQHLTLFPDGVFVTGRDFDKPPAGIKGQNGTNARHPLMIEMIGDFDKGRDKLEGKQLDSILAICKYFFDYDSPIIFHNEHSGKTCPGSGISKVDFIKQVSQYGKPKHDYAGHWAEDSIKSVLASGKMNGFPDGSFKPDEPLTRAQLAHLIATGKI